MPAVTSRMALMPARELVAAVLAPLLIAAIIWLPVWVYLAILLVAVTVACRELLAMARASGVPTRLWLTCLAVGATQLSAWSEGLPGLAIALGASVMVLTSSYLWHPARPAGSLTGVAVTVFSVAYLSICSSCLGWLRLWAPADLGVGLVLVFLVTIWIGDSGAYYVGKSIGRHRMSPRVSPKKTWEGLAGGVIASIVTVCAVRAVTLDQLSWFDTVAIGAIIGVTGPVGDLVESLFKRDTGVKDSSNLFPGHGGMLDRTDSILYSAPWVVTFLTLRGVLQ